MIYNHIRRLRAVRDYLHDALASDEVEAILEAGRWTGSAKNLQNWAFVVITQREAQRQLASAGRFTAPLLSAPLVIALVRLPNGYEFDIGRVAQNMMLAASAIGIASCPVTLHMEERAAKILGLPPGHTCRYAIAFGHPDAEADRRTRVERRREGWGGRKPLQELVHWERFERGNGG